LIYIIHTFYDPGELQRFGLNKIYSWSSGGRQDIQRVSQSPALLCTDYWHGLGVVSETQAVTRYREFSRLCAGKDAQADLWEEDRPKTCNAFMKAIVFY
jgi:hypothetical protein